MFMTINEVSLMTGLSQDTLCYYERVGMIPRVTRTAGGTRNYGEEDIRWVNLAKCMRSAGLPVEVMIEYLELFRQGDDTIPARLELLREQMTVLEEQKRAVEETMERLSFKIDRYEDALVTGRLDWDGKDKDRNTDTKRG